MRFLTLPVKCSYCNFCPRTINFLFVSENRIIFRIIGDDQYIVLEIEFDVPKTNSKLNLIELQYTTATD